MQKETIDAITPTLQAFRHLVVTGQITKEQAMQELCVSRSYLSRIVNRRRPPTLCIVCKMFSMVSRQQFGNNKEYAMK